jgi:adenylate kinase
MCEWLSKALDETLSTRLVRYGSITLKLAVKATAMDQRIETSLRLETEEPITFWKSVARAVRSQVLAFEAWVE